MDHTRILLNGLDLSVVTVRTAIVGSGAAGLSAADRLFELGEREIALITEGMYCGTSRNTGSDKQTYYKLTLAGTMPDSIQEMAQTLFSGGSTDGDTALVEAALSARCFFRLVDIGVPFPHTAYGEYVGYKTDHDPRQRATSVGPLTSRWMTEKLQTQVEMKGIPVLDNLQVVGILTNENKTSLMGLMAIRTEQSSNDEPPLVLINCTNVIWAAGGPAGLYAQSVYPESQLGANGWAYEAGAAGQNLTESQFGIASLKFRWNLSGSYQQVLPRYVSTDQNGGSEEEFLQEAFPSLGAALDAVFLKGYQWPFDPRKLQARGSSLIDALVYQESVVKGRRVFLDFTANPGSKGKCSELNFSLLGSEAYEYLQNSSILFGTPIERLQTLNQPAIELYRDNGIDLHNEPLEIGLCAQHCNGGLAVNAWWETSLKHLFAIGEAAGTHGVYRPGGSALNAGQVGALRAAQYIAARCQAAPPRVEVFLEKTRAATGEKLELIQRMFRSKRSGSQHDIRCRLQKLLSSAAGPIRTSETVAAAMAQIDNWLCEMRETPARTEWAGLPDRLVDYQLLLTARAHLTTIADYIQHGGRSRGSYLTADPNGDKAVPELDEVFRSSLESTDSWFASHVQTVRKNSADTWQCSWRPVRPIPQSDTWFETVWRAYRNDEIIRSR